MPTNCRVAWGAFAAAALKSMVRLTPFSVDDRNVTSQLVAAGQLLDIPVHDHVIVGRGRFVSFAEAGLL